MDNSSQWNSGDSVSAGGSSNSPPKSESRGSQVEKAMESVSVQASSKVALNSVAVQAFE